MSIRITFTDPKGKIVEATCEAGDNLLSVGQAAGLPLEGTCEGQMACSTCHVIVAQEWFGKLPEAAEPEEDMLDFAADVRPTSRLACQIDLTDDLDGIAVEIPGEAHDARGM
ncbi:MAG: 2Fe-2S iron-sulfur cluster-binding protein [Marinomonas sp.]